MWDTARKIIDLLRPRDKRHAALLLGMTLVVGLIETAGIASIMPFIAVLADPGTVESNPYLSAAYEKLGFSTSEDFLFFLGFGVFVIVVGGTALKAVTNLAVLRFTYLLEYTLSRRLFEGFLQRPYPWFLTRHSADLTKAILSEVGQVIGGSLTPAMLLVTQGIITLLLVGLLVLVDPLLAVITSATLGGAYGLTYWLTRHYLARIGEDRVRANNERFRLSNEAFGGIKDVKVLGLENVFLQRFENPSLRYARQRAASHMVAQLPSYALQAIAFGGILMIVQYQLLLHGSLSQALPVIALYAFAASRLLPNFQRLYQSVSSLRFSKPALDVLHRDLMECSQGLRTNETKSATQLASLHVRHQLELRNVSYTYPGASSPALNDVSVVIPVRSAIGLVGKTGGGKSTLVDIVLGLLEPQEGCFLVDGTRITEEHKRAWQLCVGYVPQHIFLSDDTVAANIAFGVPAADIDLNAVERAARIANLHAFVVEELEHGYETLIGERGVRLSGGQRQRIGIARALYRDPQVIIMDEATSSLDNITERVVMDAVDNLSKQKTIIMIAHRLTTVRHCDKIYLLERGRFVASGRYDELLHESNEFQAMVKSAVD